MLRYLSNKFYYLIRDTIFIRYIHLYFTWVCLSDITLSMLTCEYKQVINYEEHLNTIIIFLIITCSVKTHTWTCTHTHVNNKHFLKKYEIWPDINQAIIHSHMQSRIIYGLVMQTPYLQLTIFYDLRTVLARYLFHFSILNL